LTAGRVVCPCCRRKCHTLPAVAPIASTVGTPWTCRSVPLALATFESPLAHVPAIHFDRSLFYPCLRWVKTAAPRATGSSLRGSHSRPRETTHRCLSPGVHAIAGSGKTGIAQVRELGGSRRPSRPRY
jgi:hypothetical protein